MSNPITMPDGSTADKVTVYNLGGNLVDRSGTITAGGTRQQAAAANTARRYLLIQNPTTGTTSIWVNFGTNAALASPSVEIVPGMTFIWEGSFVPTQSVDVIASVTGTPFTVKEG